MLSTVATRQFPGGCCRLTMATFRGKGENLRLQPFPCFSGVYINVRICGDSFSLCVYDTFSFSLSCLWHLFIYWKRVSKLVCFLCACAQISRLWHEKTNNQKLLDHRHDSEIKSTGSQMEEQWFPAPFPGSLGLRSLLLDHYRNNLKQSWLPAFWKKDRKHTGDLISCVFWTPLQQLSEYCPKIV